MAITLYLHEWFPPSRSVVWLLKWLGVEFEAKAMIARGETMKPWFHKINPQHTVPTLVDDDLIVTESRAACTYLINKYAPDHSLYATCPRKRAVIDRYLYFDIGTLYKAICDYFFPLLIAGKELDSEKEQKIRDALGFLEAFLGDSDFLGGNEACVADLSIGCTLTMLEITSYGFPGYPKAEAYYNRIKKLPHWDEVNNKGVEGYKQFARAKLQPPKKPSDDE